MNDYTSKIVHEKKVLYADINAPSGFLDIFGSHCETVYCCQKGRRKQ